MFKIQFNLDAQFFSPAKLFYAKIDLYFDTKKNTHFLNIEIRLDAINVMKFSFYCDFSPFPSHSPRMPCNMSHVLASKVARV